MWLNIETGGFEYSRLLQLFRKNLSFFPSLVHCLLNHQDTLFTEEDKQPYRHDKGESPSLMLNSARQVAKAWMESGERLNLSIDSVLSLLDKTRIQTQDNQHKIWLDYDEAKCLIMAGRNNDAREFIIPVLKKKQSESWAWGALAATYRKENTNVAITLFTQGLCHAHDEKFALPLLKGLAPLLASKSFIKEASMCIQKATNCYQENGWKIKPDLEKLLNESWFDRTVNLNELNSFLEQQSQGAIGFLYGSTRLALGLVIKLHKSGKGLNLYLSENETISVPLRLFKKQKTPALGNHVNITVSEDREEKSVIAAELTSPQYLSGVESFQGTLNVKEKGFGFVEDTFIPAFLIKDGIDNQLIEGLRFRQFDKKKERLGWCAASIIAIEENETTALEYINSQIQEINDA